MSKDKLNVYQEKIELLFRITKKPTKCLTPKFTFLFRISNTQYILIYIQVIKISI